MVAGVLGAIWKLLGLVPTEKRQVVWVVPQGMAGSPLPQPRRVAGGCKRCGCRYWLPLPLLRGGGPELGRDGRPNSHLQVAPSRKPRGRERLRPGQTRPLLLAQVWLGVMGRCSPHPRGPRGAGVPRVRPSRVPVSSGGLPADTRFTFCCFFLLGPSCV